MRSNFRKTAIFHFWAIELLLRNTFEKKRLIDEGDYENENAQVPENNNSSDKESNREVSDFLSSEDSVMNGYLKNNETECFIQKQLTRDVLQK